ncbi:MAG: hypothetical protein P8X49_15650, partial [Syntrophobacterales bacterium]
PGGLEMGSKVASQRCGNGKSVKILKKESLVGDNEGRLSNSFTPEHRLKTCATKFLAAGRIIRTKVGSRRLEESLTSKDGWEEGG